ncbi:MAG: hypothetical protein OEL55_04235 [Desulfobulbaceae bacterium]|nr:hypothetical protein [Desulfobulbaceae bacterium]
MLFHIICEYSNSGLSSIDTFTVMQLTTEDGSDYSFLTDQSRHYCSFNDLRQEIATQLKVPVDEVELEEV